MNEKLNVQVCVKDFGLQKYTTLGLDVGIVDGKNVKSSKRLIKCEAEKRFPDVIRGESVTRVFSPMLLLSCHVCGGTVYIAAPRRHHFAATDATRRCSGGGRGADAAIYRHCAAQRRGCRLLVAS